MDHCSTCKCEKFVYIQMCNCFSDVMDHCINCESDPVKMTEKEFKEYTRDLDEKLKSMKKEMYNLKHRINSIWRKTGKIECNNCTKYKDCDSCRRLYDL